MKRKYDKLDCVRCGKAKSTAKCAGCSLDYCFKHLEDHRNDFGGLLHFTEVDCDRFQQKLDQQSKNIKNNVLFKNINQWENDSIRFIQQTAKQCRQTLTQLLTERVNEIDRNLSNLNHRIKRIRQENDYNEIDLDQIQQKLAELSRTLGKISDIEIKQHSTSFINKISIVPSSQELDFPSVNSNTKWQQDGITILGGNEAGNQVHQLSNPFGIRVDDDNECIYIADPGNNRIIKYDYNANIATVITVGDEEEDSLNHPTDMIIDKQNDSLIISDKRNRQVIRWSNRNKIFEETLISDIACFGLTMDQHGDLYVYDRDEHEVRRWRRGEEEETIVAGGNGKGNNLDQLNYPRFLFVDKEYSVYVSDWMNHRIMKWINDATEGSVVAGGQGRGDDLSQLSNPNGVIVDDEGNVYVSDTGNNRVMRWSPGSEDGHIIIGGNGKGDQPNQLDEPTGLSLDRYGNLYVVDSGNKRIQKFLRD